LGITLYGCQSFGQFKPESTILWDQRLYNEHVSFEPPTHLMSVWDRGALFGGVIRGFVHTEGPWVIIPWIYDAQRKIGRLGPVMTNEQPKFLDISDGSLVFASIDNPYQAFVGVSEPLESKIHRLSIDGDPPLMEIDSFERGEESPQMLGQAVECPQWVNAPADKRCVFRVMPNVTPRDPNVLRTVGRISLLVELAP